MLKFLILFNVSLIGLRMGWFVFNFSYLKLKRRDLWQCLDGIAPSNEAWFIAGDFNIVRRKIWGNSIDFSAAAEFNDFIFRCGLTEFSCLGSGFTWKKSGHRMWQKLDRYLANSKWKMAFSDCVVSHLNREFSDHAPLVGGMVSC